MQPVTDIAPRDGDRSAVYAAELAAFDGTDLETVLPFAGIAAAVDWVTTGEWWPGPLVRALPARRDAVSSSTRCRIESPSESSGRAGAIEHSAQVEIRLAAGQCTIATAAHELAHALAGVGAGHGPTFRQAYLDIVAVITNRSSLDRRHDLHVAQLADAFAAIGLSVGERHWPAPPAGAIGAIAL